MWTGTLICFDTDLQARVCSQPMQSGIVSKNSTSDLSHTIIVSQSAVGMPSNCCVPAAFLGWCLKQLRDHFAQFTS